MTSRRVRYILLLLLITMTACSDGAKIEVLTAGSDQAANAAPSSSLTSSDPVLETAEVIRAKGIAGQGMLLVIPQGKETIEPLGAPSLFGKEEDLMFKADYTVLYKHGEQEETVAELKDQTFIQPVNEPVVMQKLSVEDKYIFILTPRYQDGHGMEFYAFVVDHVKEEAYQAFFQVDDQVSLMSYYKPGTQPMVRSDLLVLQSVEGPGGETPEGPPDRIFRLDAVNRVFVYK